MNFNGWIFFQNVKNGAFFQNWNPGVLQQSLAPMVPSSLPHLSVSTSTPPPPSSSPPVRIKAEPISPPRIDPHHHQHNNSATQQQQQHLTTTRPGSGNDPGHLSPSPSLQATQQQQIHNPHLTAHLHAQQQQQQHHQTPHQQHQQHHLYPHHDTGHLTPTSHASPEPLVSQSMEFEPPPLSKKPRLNESWTT